jgi:NAD(P)-dependent dehydrogenase (short-subunit alcohol dehydrogenase family)
MAKEPTVKGKIVLVTGASGGLGACVTQAFLDAGATVIGTSRRIRQSDFDSAGFAAIPGEISSQAGATALVDAVVSRFTKFDVLAHTVGGFAGGQTVADTDDATFQRMFDLNVTSFFYILRASIPILRKSDSGRIVSIGSRAAVEPGAGVGAYGASKAAMVSLVKTVAAENRDAGVTANVILPGTLDTKSNRMAMPGADFSKWVQPPNVASLAVWLASDAAKDISGAAIPVYGDV